MHTSLCTIEVEFFDPAAPKTVANFRKLAPDGFLQRKSGVTEAALRVSPLGDRRAGRVRALERGPQRG